MVDFEAAFNEGIEAAKKAELARKEIDAVFSRLNAKLTKVSNGKLKIYRAKLPKKGTSYISPLAQALIPRPTYSALVAINPTVKGSPKKELARWELDPRGYPCKIEWSGQERYCEDKEALENCLADLMRDPIVGQKFYALMKIEAKAEQKDTAQQKDTPDKK